MLRKIRIALATIFFAGITLLFLDFTGTLHHYLSWMAKLQFLPAVLSLNVVVLVILLLLTLVFGRIYCSVICPLGVMQDLMASVRRKKNRYSYSPAVSWLRYLMLAVMVVAVAAGIGSLVALLAPYSSFGRIATHLLQPLYMGVNNVLASLAERADSYAFYSVDVWLRTLPTLIIAAVTFVVLFILAWRNGRTYCNTICPVGTVLGFVARFSWLKVPPTSAATAASARRTARPRASTTRPTPWTTAAAWHAATAWRNASLAPCTTPPPPRRPPLRLSLPTCPTRASAPSCSPPPWPAPPSWHRKRRRWTAAWP